LQKKENFAGFLETNVRKKRLILQEITVFFGAHFPEK